MAANKSLRRRTTTTNPSTKKKITTKSTKSNGTKKTKATAATTTPIKPTPPSIEVTDASSPEQILHASWKFLYCYQFLSLFRTFLKLPVITIETLEEAIMETKKTTKPGLARSEGSFLADEINSRLVLDTTTIQKDVSLQQLLEQIFSILLKHIQSRQANPTNCHGYLYDYLLDHDDNDDISLSKSKEDWTLFDLSIPEKIRVLKSLIDLMEKTDLMMNLRADIAPETLRLAPIGIDSEGWRYWMFNSTRLYRELPLPQRKGMPMLMGKDYTFELVCDTLETWQECLTRFSTKTRNHNEKALSLEINEIAPQVITKLENRLAAKAREEAKLERLRKLEELPRKRSRRLEIKEDELNKRRRVDEIEQQRIALEKQEREQAKKREKEQKHLEQEQMIQIETDLKNYVYELITSKIDEAIQREDENAAASVTANNENNSNEAESTSLPTTPTPETRTKRRTSPFIRDTPEIAFLQELRGILRKSAKEEDRVEKMQGWATLLDQDNLVSIQKGPHAEIAPLQIGQGLILQGNGVSGDLTSPLLKNILRVYLSTLPKETSDMGMDLTTIRKKLLLDRYTSDERFSGLENFLQDLDLLLPGESERIGVISPQKYAADLLVRIFQKR
ncbi:hypothetical protein BDA99DRAFT_605620 [Phascolomyces articulosus]|uniref:DDT domain-containing protein n=1 Tax=Phascolomyces articulosus TaxID=60185 RepID=A0AAD5PEQ9_9FUNG|nr:hypothetical protein BDA99DRAFT_605620 [Phascolomyces articulosus]